MFVSASLTRAKEDEECVDDCFNGCDSDCFDGCDNDVDDSKEDDIDNSVDSSDKHITYLTQGI
eukprot:9577135-Ditylum_brightwellii.AAC.1